MIVVADLDLARPLAPLDAPEGATAARLLVRLHGRPLQEVTVPLRAGRADVDALAAALGRALPERLAAEALRAWLAAPPATRPGAWRDGAALAAMLDRLAPEPDPSGHPARALDDGGDDALPSITVAVCTRDRPADLARCLAAIARLDYPRFEVVVVDNAPATDETALLVAARFPEVRYVLEPRPGLDWARNRAALEARGAVLAYTDDDVCVDPGWLRALGSLFAAAPGVAAVTGSVLPAELATEAQRRFEAYGGFLRGWQRRWHRVPRLTRRRHAEHHGAGQFGTGANLAVRTAVLRRLGGFDPALDVGTATNGGGDLELLFRLLQEGHTLVYEPAAVVRHHHRRDRPALARQLDGWGRGLFAYVHRSRAAYPGERAAFGRLARWWWRRHLVPRLVRALRRPDGAIAPREVLAEARGALGARRAWAAAQRQAAAVRAMYPEQPLLEPVVPDDAPPSAAEPRVAVRTLDLDAPLAPLGGLEGYTAVELVLLERGAPVAQARAVVEEGGVSVAQQQDVIGAALLPRLPAAERHRLHDAAHRWLARRARDDAPASPSVSVVLCTLDRPDDLRACLRSLVAQRYAAPYEILVVDNHPASGLTARVAAEFPEARLVEEPRTGLSYARNAGILAARGEIIVCTDDDVVAPADWLQRLTAPFARADVAIVTGHVLPLELETESQRDFERYGGLGRGCDRREFTPEWLAQHPRAVPTWELGATANTAVRARCFADPAVGLFDEALGPGAAGGCGEDTLVFYRVLRAGGTLVYEPSAYVWHRHRREPDALARQIRSYSTGHVAYHLTTLLDERDRRAVRRLLVDLPLYDLRSLWRAVRGRPRYPLALVLHEISGHLAGPWALWRARARVRRLGRSGADPVAGRRDAPDALHVAPPRVAGRQAADARVGPPAGERLVSTDPPTRAPLADVLVAAGAPRPERGDGARPGGAPAAPPPAR